MEDKIKNPFSKVGLGLVLLLVCAVQLLPFYVSVTTALKDRTDLSSQWAFPTTQLTFENFSTAIEQGNILRAIFNSVVITLFSTVLICVLGALAAYPLARRSSKGNNLVLALIISMMMIPPLSILVPIYSFMNQIGALNTYWGAILIPSAVLSRAGCCGRSSPRSRCSSCRR